MTQSAAEYVKQLATKTQSEFESHQTILSFGGYMDELMAHPRLHLRNAARYLCDVIDHFGTDEIEHPTGKVERYRLFDAAFADGRGRVIGQERVQMNLVRLLRNFVRAGKVDRMLLLHGPNGSAKTSIIQAIGAAAETYSQTDAGALYRFNWIFPTSGAQRGALGFGGAASASTDSYALLKGDSVQARLPCEFKDHPLLLLPQSAREALFEELYTSGAWPKTATIPEVLRTGDLSPKNRAIFDALMATYHGDMQEVLRHVQVERFYLSRRYRRGVASVEPQMSVDAYARQVTADRNLSTLPTSLHHLSLFETGGPLSDANRGIVEFNDLLKRPVDAWKYLLVATEQAQAGLDQVNLFLDLIMMGSSNELHLSAFKEHHDWPSFKGRFELVTVPYLLRASDETEVYADQIPKALTGVHIAPHSLEVAARWATLTRLEPPQPERYPKNVQKLVEGLRPGEKLELYDSGVVPERFSQRERRDLREIAEDLHNEFADEVDFEGRYGASAREVRTLILNAAQSTKFDHLSPMAVLDELRALVKETSSYPFLRRDPERGYRDAKQFVLDVDTWFLKTVTEEIRQAMGLVAEGSHTDLFASYLKHVSAWTKKEKIENTKTGKLEPADESLMKEVENVLLADDEKADDFRRSIIAQVGAYRLEHPDDDVDYELLFGTYMRRLKDDFYRQRHSAVKKLEEQFLKVLDDDVKDIEAKDLQQVQTFRENLYALGYTDSSARQAIAFILNRR